MLIAANSCLKNVKHIISNESLQQFNIDVPQVFFGKIATGDQFITDVKKAELIKKEMPDVLAVEMEGAAIAQVCKDHNIPFSVIRIISDKANCDTIVDFPKFVDLIAKEYSLEIIKQLYTLIKTET